MQLQTVSWQRQVRKCGKTNLAKQKKMLQTQAKGLYVRVGNGKGFKLLRMVKKEQHESVGKKLENKMRLKEAPNIKKSFSKCTYSAYRRPN